MAQFHRVDPTALQTSVAQLGSIYKGSKIIYGVDDIDEFMPRLQLDIPTLNYVLSGRYFGPKAGLPLGKVVNVSGDFSSGKTSLCLYLAGQAIKSGGSVHWIDKETTFDPDYAKLYGIDADDQSSFGISYPEFAEQAFDTMITLIDNAAYNIIVLDSVPSLAGEQAYEKNSNENSMAILARRLAEFFPRIMTKLVKNNVTLLFINQERANIQGGMAYGKKSTGGNAMMFYPHIHLQLKKGDDITKGTGFMAEYVGRNVYVKATKNKTARPLLSTELSIFPECGISREADYLNLAMTTGIIKKAGSWIKSVHPDIQFNVQGIENARLELINNPSIMDDMAVILNDILAPQEIPMENVDINTGEILSEPVTETEQTNEAA